MNLDRDLHFRGNRDYLQSATLFDDILGLQDGNAGNIDFNFNKKSDRQVHYQSTAPECESSLVATWRDDTQKIFVVEREEVIQERIPYDEEALVDKFTFDALGVVIPRDIDGYSLMEAVVAAFKALLHRTVATHKPKVVFVRVRLRSLPALPLEVRYGRRIGEFYQGNICSANQVIGQVFFGEWR